METIGVDLASGPDTSVVVVVRESDKQLMAFYSVDGLPGLIDAMERHIARLQAKSPLNQQAAWPYPLSPRQG